MREYIRACERERDEAVRDRLRVRSIGLLENVLGLALERAPGLSFPTLGAASSSTQANTSSFRRIVGDELGTFG